MCVCLCVCVCVCVCVFLLVWCVVFPWSRFILHKDLDVQVCHEPIYVNILKNSMPLLKYVITP